MKFILLAIAFLLTISLLSMPVNSFAQETEPTEQTLQLNPEQATDDPSTKPSSQADDPTPIDNTNNIPESTPNKPQKIQAPTPSISLFKQDIEKFMSKESVTPMMAGTEDFMTLVQNDLHPTDKGVMILIPEWQQIATSPKAINFLRQYLPKDGWATITVQPLEKPILYPSRAEKEIERNTENEEVLAKYTEKFIPMMAKVFEEASNYPGIFVVVAEGNNAAILVELFEQKQLPMPNAMVLLSAHQLNPEDNQRFAVSMSNSNLPILDLYLSSDNRWVHHFVKLRRQLALREMKTYYRQRQFKSFSPSYYPEKELAKTIKGWISSIGW